MNTEMLQIRWHGRGGQGAKTAASMFAEAAIGLGKYAQAAPEYGAERQGAPVRAYTRISPEPIREHDAISRPDVVAVLDDSLINENVTEGLSQEGILLVNTELSPEEIKEHLSWKGKEVHTADATGIALEETGRPIPNTVMIGAVLKAVEIFSVEEMEETMREKLKDKLGKEVTEKNIRAVHRAFEEEK